MQNACIYLCVVSSLPVTWQWWRSYHLTCRNRKPRKTHKPHGSMFYRTEVVDHSNFYIADTCISTFLFVQPWPSPEVLHIRVDPIPWIYTGCAKINFVRQVIVWRTDRQTRPKLYTTPLRGWSKLSLITIVGERPILSHFWH